MAPETNGATRFSGGVVDLRRGQGHTRHNHPGAEEIIFVISGNGEQMVEDPDGNPVVQKVGPGCTIYVPESRFHSTLNTGDGPMQLFVVYSPAGPELGAARPARFPAGAAKRQIDAREKSGERDNSAAPPLPGRCRL